ncbi:MAG: alpha-amylase family glycosyl hydrolase [Acidimicrobiales bacterium]
MELVVPVHPPHAYPHAGLTSATDTAASAGGSPSAHRPLTVSVRAPDAREVVVCIRPAAGGPVRRVDAERWGAPTSDDGRTGWWRVVTTAHGGDHYWLEVDGGAPLVDPSAEALAFVDGRPIGVVRGAPWPSRPQLGHVVPHPVVYETHVRGFARTFAGMHERLGYLADLGVDVIELMPVHPFDTSDNYWGYMPVVWGAVHQPYAAGDDAATELADLVAAAHAHGLAVWIDVVFNHTGEGDSSRATWSLRGLDPTTYRTRPDGTPFDDSGCGNDADPAHPWVRALVLEALDRYADLGIDGFRFDLASLLTRDGGELARRIGDWAEQRGVTLVAEAWDLAAYQVGAGFPDARWRQWNDRFRDDVRGFVRGEAGLVAAMAQRVQGSPDLFGDEAWRTVNFVTAHDGLCLYDLTTVTSDRHRSWDCGPDLRPQQLRNHLTHLLLSAGAAMFVMGDEFARTQRGHDNPYDVDGPISWVDWHRLVEWGDLHGYVQALLRARRHLDHDHVQVYGVHGEVDLGHDSRSLAWCSGEVYVMANAWWEPLVFSVVAPGTWHLELATSPDTEQRSDGTVVLAPRSMAVLMAAPSGGRPT